MTEPEAYSQYPEDIKKRILDIATNVAALQAMQPDPPIHWFYCDPDETHSEGPCLEPGTPAKRGVVYFGAGRLPLGDEE